MAMVRVTPTEIKVRVGWLDGRPRSIRVANEDLLVTHIDQIRDEIAAYPVASGPRRIFEVRTSENKLRLSFEHRRRRWLLEGLEAA